MVKDRVSKSLMLLGILLVAIPAGILVLPDILGSNGEKSEIIRLTWQRTGGFAGIYETLIIDADGTANYAVDIPLSYQTQYTLALTELEELMNTAGRFTEDILIGASPGAADYFIYEVMVETTSREMSIIWVDEWAAQSSLPSEIRVFQLQMEDLI